MLILVEFGLIDGVVNGENKHISGWVFNPCSQCAYLVNNTVAEQIFLVSEDLSMLMQRFFGSFYDPF